MTTSEQVETKTDPMERTRRILAARCVALGTPVAIVGSRESARLLLEALQETPVKVMGIFDSGPDTDTLLGYPVQSPDKLSGLRQDVSVIVASGAPSVDLKETLDRLRTLFAGRILCLEQLLDLPRLFEGLKSALDYKYDPMLLDESSLHLQGQVSPWPHMPEGFSVRGKTVLEFGPFEGLFSLMLMQQEPKRIIALEGRPDNYAKTAALKAYMDWSNYTLRFGDMHLFPSIVPEPVDVIFCSGVLYHSPKPWWLLQACMEKCDTIILGTQVASEHSPSGRFFKEVELEPGRFRFEVFHEGGDNLSGLSPYSLWFYEEDLARFADHYGFDFAKHTEWVNPEGLWINARLTRR